MHFKNKKGENRFDVMFVSDMNGIYEKNSQKSMRLSYQISHHSSLAEKKAMLECKELIHDVMKILKWFIQRHQNKKICVNNNDY